MATSTNSKVFVSPGVYTSEVDLSFVAQSVGVTTLGVVGETLKGPAFEPIFIRNFDEFSTFFGGTSPEKFVNTQIPKYETAYIAKSYLQQSNQLFVTRILGLSGYDAGPSWSITTKANVDPSTVVYSCITTGKSDCDIICLDYLDSGFTIPFTACTNSTGSITYDTSNVPSEILGKINLPYEKFNGSSSSLDEQIRNQIFGVINEPSTQTESIYFYGPVPHEAYSAYTAQGFTGRTNVFEVDNLDGSLIDFSASTNDSWYYAMFDNLGGGLYTGSSTSTIISQLNLTSSLSNCASFYNFNLSGHVTNTNITSDPSFYGGSGGYSVTTTPVSTTTNGSGIGLTVNITSVDGSNVITGLDIVNPGIGYQVGDMIYISSSGNGDAEFAVTSITGTTGGINYNTNTISLIAPANVDLTNIKASFSACCNSVKIGNATQTSDVTVNDFSGQCLTYTLVSNDSTVTTNWTVCVTNYDNCAPTTTGNVGTMNLGTITDCYTGVLSGTTFFMSGNSYTEYDDLVIATFRSRGVADFSTDDGAVYEINDVNNLKIVTSGLYSGASKNPFSTFLLNATSRTGTNFSFETSFSISDAKFISKVFGSSNFAKDRNDVPLFVEEKYLALLTHGWRKGFIRGLNPNLTALPDARQGADPSSIGFYLEQYQTPESPWVVSELRGSQIFRLFKFVTISDGNSANTEIKISITNISFSNGTFDVLIRDYFDSDSAPVVLEKFTNCTMDPNQNNFIAKKIGSVDGEYALNSKYVMIEINENAPEDSLPCGFEGYNTRTYLGSTSPFPIYKTKYNYPGELVFDPPFGLPSGANNATRSPGDNVRRTYLGISDTVGYDVDFVSYKGKQLPTSICTSTTGALWDTKTKGFHMDINASSIKIKNTFYQKVLDTQTNTFKMSGVTKDTDAFYVGSGDFSKEPTLESNPYYRLYSRKFTLLVQGGFDGWDIYRESRTNTDRFVLGRSGYLKGACPSVKYPNATGWGAFKEISIGDKTQPWANTDYYAYLLGQRTFVNPEAVNINVFATPGIDYVNHSDMVESAIDMIENDRADSIYICTTPDFKMFTPTMDVADLIYPQEAVDNLETTGIDSNYTATYYPWVLTRDSVNNTQIYLPATAEVTRNLALTDNIAFPWFAAAGYTRGIVNSIKARKKLTQEDRDVLYNGRINPIATFSDVGTVIWGNKTLQIRESALDRINVRRLLLQARKLISAVSVRLLFEQNDQKVRQDFLNAVNPILDAIRRDRGLYDFRVSVSSDTADLDRNQMTGKIYLKPTKSLEFIDITFYITPTGASFENI